MRNMLLLSFALVLSAGPGWAQQPGAPAKPGATAPKPDPAKPGATAPKPDPAKPAPPTAKPTPAPQQPRRAAQPAARSGVAMTIVDAMGATLPGVTVDMTGPTPREGVSDDSGQLNFPGLQAGTYRLRFTGDTVTTFEREVTLRAGQVEKLTIQLTPAARAAAPLPAPAPAPAPAAPPPARVGPTGQPHVLSVIDLVERELINNKQPRKDTLIACSGNTRSMLVQLNEPQATRVYDDAEALYYVVAGEGAINVSGRDVALVAGGYAALPRGASHSLTRKGRRPLILLAVLSGEPCEEAK
jgi:mannose-6-phosphate isomerase-like protein (cupin superfamily)